MAATAYSEYFNSLNNEDKEGYLRKLTLETGDLLPDPFTLENWGNDV